MLGLPISTEIRKIITKKKVYEQFGAEMNAERRKKFDADIARMVLTNEVSPVSVNLPAGETVQSLFVLQVFLKAKSFDPQNIAYLAKLFGQRLVLVLEAESCQRIAVWQTRLIMTDWEVPGARTLSLWIWTKRGQTSLRRLPESTWDRTRRWTSSSPARSKENGCKRKSPDWRRRRELRNNRSGSWSWHKK